MEKYKRYQYSKKSVYFNDIQWYLVDIFTIHRNKTHISGFKTVEEVHEFIDYLITLKKISVNKT